MLTTGAAGRLGNRRMFPRNHPQNGLNPGEPKRGCSHHGEAVDHVSAREPERDGNVRPDLDRIGPERVHRRDHRHDDAAVRSSLDRGLSKLRVRRKCLRIDRFHVAWWLNGPGNRRDCDRADSPIRPVAAHIQIRS
jgi:hypothetical protein